ncbi:hypothetical protein BDY21DRAFT_411484 [Lineolata rhizophorae]|uniref:Uncharacterized protein n=1 Tax=Lineolata rhizophorae TaxID=578093 RepID=A0A6A6P2Y7_9PEZI|nr:hypothetical protein BDY21DRAFT_411484 [Lineolata rhizophorae]
MPHHCTLCKKVANNYCFRKGHLFRCEACDHMCEQREGCASHPFRDGYNAEKELTRNRRRQSLIPNTPTGAQRPENFAREGAQEQENEQAVDETQRPATPNRRLRVTIRSPAEDPPEGGWNQTQIPKLSWKNAKKEREPVEVEEHAKGKDGKTEERRKK